MSKTMKGLIAGLIVLALATAGVIVYAKLSEPDYSKVPYPTVTITMENGDEIHLELYPDVAPNTVANFVQLAQDGFYDGTIFHRVIAGFMIQGGDPTGTGYGGESMWKRPFEDEIVKGVEFDKPFLLAMANAGRCTNNSQFFITTVPTPWLNGKHTIFGKVLKGQSVVKDIERTRVMNESGKPFDDIKIVSADTYSSLCVCC